MPPIDAVLIGAGQRGRDAFGAFAKRHPDELRFVAVVDKDESKRKKFAQDHGISNENCFSDSAEFFQHPPLAPICFNATMDREHLPTALPALEKGYHLFLEKPMADTPDGCVKIREEANRRNLMVQICHPLRFNRFYKKIKELIDNGAVGRVIGLIMCENVAYWHYAHSYVRGNWGRIETAAPFIVSKCCHDMDIAAWLADGTVEHVASTGGLSFFIPENAPAGAPDRCVNGCPAEMTCPYFAPALYLTDYIEWPVTPLSLDLSLESRRRAIETGPYGRCVFKCGNNIADHQVVIAGFKNGVALNFSVFAHTFHPYRSIRVLGTEGEIAGHPEKADIKIFRFGQGAGGWFGDSPQPETIAVEAEEGAHGGGDTGVIRNLLDCYRRGDYQAMKRSLDVAVEGHLLAFAAESARLEKRTIIMNA
ncbi:MAG TPA: Gfo/Idh/MocA family oxidoreductase [Candidatus Sumerlaeota bacterium]|nr:MAG: putative oxidoreductase YteT precursor [candidate division BRC1 bacterium ADurb.Bin183]HOE63047.1 Gfo/Idh/MocA family oxidoreductase [Candidatus Sumerlaeota bacterium]HRR31178.1 Gfo/Idh/MocA family oxidoreductase [Candidatus Sumerlaeia bacterium]HON49525.1 Gfo/Idh/MocA family oxidoreductase [Candidatus Sumerlaeota bacterium]HOR64676.1 Gfo/Idh/MocA family oxidoreductase [Candidatus Sumerlaeota bacterium]